MNFTDFDTLQTFAAHTLLSDAYFDNVNIVTRDRLLAEVAEGRLPDKTLAAEVLVYITPRVLANGRRGLGIIVEKIEFEVTRPNLNGPQGDMILTCLILEDRLSNNSPAKGTLVPGDHAAQKILDLLHNQPIHPFGHFYADTRAIQEATDFQPLDAWRVRLRMTSSRTQTARVATPVAAEADGLVTLTCATEDARIYYSLDRSFPGPSNPAALEYAAPFAVEAGDEIFFAAFKTGYSQSSIQHATIT